MAIQRGTTPFVFFNIGDLIDTFDDDTEIYIDFRQGTKIKLEIREDKLYKDYENKRLLCKFSQINTLDFNKRLNVYIQLRVKYSDGTAIKSKVLTVRADELIKEGVI